MKNSLEFRKQWKIVKSEKIKIKDGRIEKMAGSPVTVIKKAVKIIKFEIKLKNYIKIN